VITLLFLAAIAVGAMGFAIQRGGTCTVAAVDEILTHRRAHRLSAMLEASLWVAGALAIGQLLGIARSMPAHLPVTTSTVLGGVLLGLGAWVNGACVFGAIARLGSGEWAYLATPVGFYAGCLTVMPFLTRPEAAPTRPWAFAVSAIGAALFIAYAIWRVVPALRQPRALRMKVWAPHAATIVIGITFVITLLAVGRWAYTDVLADLAAGMARQVGLGVALLIALYAGALLGGWTAGRWRQVAPAPLLVLRCFAGGALMAWGSLLIPGSNDALILIGIPLLQPYAWLAFAVMVVTIAAALTAQRLLIARPSASSH
jgi:toxin CptA